MKFGGFQLINNGIRHIHALCDDIVEELKPVFAENNPERGRIQDAWRFSENVRQLATAPKIMETLENLYGRKPFAFQTLNFQFGTQQMAHSDTIHFNSLPEGYMCGIWTALEDITDDAGPLEYWTGSEKLPIYDYQDLGIETSNNPDKDYAIYEQKIQKVLQDANLKPVRVLARKGDSFIWDANLIHGGSKVDNVGKTRWSQVTHYYFEDCKYLIPRLSTATETHWKNPPRIPEW